MTPSPKELATEPAIIEQVTQWLSSELADSPATPRVFVLANRFGVALVGVAAWLCWRVADRWTAHIEHVRTIKRGAW